eukprot:2054420-Rhodomonas_salina.3
MRLHHDNRLEAMTGTETDGLNPETVLQLDLADEVAEHDNGKREILTRSRSRLRRTEDERSMDIREREECQRLADATDQCTRDRLSTALPSAQQDIHETEHQAAEVILDSVVQQQVGGEPG